MHTIFANNARERTEHALSKAPLQDIIRCRHCNQSMAPSYTSKKNKTLYYRYVCMKAVKNGYDDCPVNSVAA